MATGAGLFLRSLVALWWPICRRQDRALEELANQLVVKLGGSEALVPKSFEQHKAAGKETGISAALRATTAGERMERMPRHCTVCTHAERAAIDAALVESEPNRSVARRFGLNRASVDRHRARHLRPAIRAADVAEGTSVHQRMTSLYARVLALLERAESMGDVRATAASQPITRVVTGTSNFVFGIDGIGDLEQR